MLHKIKYTLNMGRNVVKAFKEIHARGVCYGDVRCKNILVRSDGTVVLVDFETSKIDADEDELNTEMKEVKYLLASLTGKR
jgi:DNA-binding helix-hairpin-helix protein with protein kinase domain